MDGAGAQILRSASNFGKITAARSSAAVVRPLTLSHPAMSFSPVADIRSRFLRGRRAVREVPSWGHGQSAMPSRPSIAIMVAVRSAISRSFPSLSENTSA